MQDTGARWLDARTDAAGAREHVARGLPYAILVSEMPNLFVLDVDVKNDAPGFQSLQALCRKSAAIAQTLASTATVQTRSGGRHYYLSRQDLSSQDLTDCLNIHCNDYPGLEFFGVSGSPRMIFGPGSPGYSVALAAAPAIVPVTGFRAAGWGVNWESPESRKASAYVRTSDKPLFNATMFLGEEPFFPVAEYVAAWPEPQGGPGYPYDQYFKLLTVARDIAEQIHAARASAGFDDDLDASYQVYRAAVAKKLPNYHWDGDDSDRAIWFSTRPAEDYGNGRGFRSAGFDTNGGFSVADYLNKHHPDNRSFLRISGSEKAYREARSELASNNEELLGPLDTMHALADSVLKSLEFAPIRPKTELEMLKTESEVKVGRMVTVGMNGNADVDSLEGLKSLVQAASRGGIGRAAVPLRQWFKCCVLFNDAPQSWRDWWVVAVEKVVDAAESQGAPKTTVASIKETMLPRTWIVGLDASMDDDPSRMVLANMANKGYAFLPSEDPKAPVYVVDLDTMRAWPVVLTSSSSYRLPVHVRDALNDTFERVRKTLAGSQRTSVFVERNFWAAVGSITVQDYEDIQPEFTAAGLRHRAISFSNDEAWFAGKSTVTIEDPDSGETDIVKFYGRNAVVVQRGDEIPVGKSYRVTAGATKDMTAVEAIDRFFREIPKPFVDLFAHLARRDDMLTMPEHIRNHEEYLQRARLAVLVALCITPSNYDSSIGSLSGGSGVGKTTFLDTIAQVMQINGPGYTSQHVTIEAVLGSKFPNYSNHPMLVFRDLQGSDKVGMGFKALFDLSAAGSKRLQESKGVDRTMVDNISAPIVDMNMPIDCPASTGQPFSPLRFSVELDPDALARRSMLFHSYAAFKLPPHIPPSLTDREPLEAFSRACYTLMVSLALASDGQPDWLWDPCRRRIWTAATGSSNDEDRLYLEFLRRSLIDWSGIVVRSTAPVVTNGDPTVLNQIVHEALGPATSTTPTAVVASMISKAIMSGKGPVWVDNEGYLRGWAGANGDATPAGDFG